MGEPSLRIFVAMPGTTAGERATWANVPEVKRRLLEALSDRLSKKLGRAVEIVFGKDKLGWVDADVYIADLSGANPNVYLELGVRWALRDGITILISQDVGQGEPLPFNVSASRVLPYGPMPDELEHAIENIVGAALDAIADPGQVDSPVRRSTELLTAPRSEWDSLHAQVRELQELHAD